MAEQAVIATAGHVDHGKSALVRALTGIEPDRWEQERARGLTIDLGYAWTQLPSGQVLSFVDVPGHQRFIGNMLAGIGPAAAVMFVVAADEGWREQSEEHLAALDALGISQGILVVTRSDLADPAAAVADARSRIAQTSLGEVDAIAVSAKTGQGIEALRARLGEFVSSLPTPRADGRTRLWIDRAFSIKGAGTVVTGTLGEGSLSVGEQLQLLSPGQDRSRPVRIRSLQSLDAPRERVRAPARTAANLPTIEVSETGRGAVLLSGEWKLTHLIDARLRRGRSDDLPEHLMLHIGTYAAQVHVRPLGPESVRLTLPHSLALTVGDRAILRNPGVHQIVAGVEVVDIDPPVLRRRGAASTRGAELTAYPLQSGQRLVSEVARRGAAAITELEHLGFASADMEAVPAGLRREGDWLIDEKRWESWKNQARELLEAQRRHDPLEPGLSEKSLLDALRLPRREWLASVVKEAGGETSGGRVQIAGARPELGAAEASLQAIEARLREAAWLAPEQHELDAAGLGPRQLAAAVRMGRLVRLPGDIVLLPSGPAQAMRVLAALPQPFTLSEARQALNTTRRVAVPLLEHLDGRGWTRRVDGSLREVVGAKPHPGALPA